MLRGRFHLYHLFSNNFSILLYLLMSSINSIAAGWGLSFLTIGLINFAGAVSYIAASLFFGRMGDRLGHKKVLMIATLLFSFFNVLGFFWSSALELFIFAIGLNIFFGTFYPQIEGLLSRREKELGIDPASTINRFTISWSTGNMVGMAMGPFLIVRYPYAVFSFGIFLSVSAFFLLRRDIARNGERIAFNPLPGLTIPSNKIDFPKIGLYRKVYRTTLVLSGLIYSAILSLFPKVISMNGLPLGMTGFLVVGANIGVFLTFIILGKFKVWVGNPKIASLFMLVFPLMTFLIFVKASALTFFGIAFFAGMSYAVPYTYAIFYGLNSPDEDHGKQGGFHEAIIGMIQGIGPLFGGIAFQFSKGMIGFGLMAVVLLIFTFAIQARFLKKAGSKRSGAKSAG